MKLAIPVVRAVMERKILLNFRGDPLTLERLLPSPFRVKRIHCWGVAGICLIRLRQARPKGLPATLGLVSENAAFRIAVEWHENGSVREGVFIPARHTNSRLNAMAGGRVFPGVHTRANFDVHESGGLYKVSMRTKSGDQDLKLLCRQSENWPGDSIFASREEALHFLHCGCAGYSRGVAPRTIDGLELHPFKWRATPLGVEHLDARFFSDPQRFPPGSVRFDSALLMRDIEHEWRPLPRLHRRPPECRAIPTASLRPDTKP